MLVKERKPLSVAEAVKRVMKYARNGQSELVSIFDCNGRFLSEDMKASHDVPRFDRSAYDGFAVRSKDLQYVSEEQPITLEVVEEIGAGHVSTKTVHKNQAIRIMTGAKMPSDCDAVVMFEVVTSVEKDSKNYITLTKPVKKGDNISFQGEDVKEGIVLVKKGTKINPGIVALLATFGCEKVPVAKMPTIGIFATGTELLEVDEELEPGKIRNSNSYMIMAQIERAGGKPVYFGKLADVLETSYQAIQACIDKVDILLTTGGVSVGDYDLLPDIYQKLGAEMLFNKVAMRPGSVTTVANLNGKLLFGLSGNPSACYVGFELFAKPIIRTMLYCDKPHLQTAEAILGVDFLTANSFTRFFRSRTEIKNGKLYTYPSGVDKSNIVSSLAFANALTVLPGTTTGYAKGENVQVLLLEDENGHAWPWK